MNMQKCEGIKGSWAGNSPSLYSWLTPTSQRNKRLTVILIFAFQIFSGDKPASFGLTEDPVLRREIMLYLGRPFYSCERIFFPFAGPASSDPYSLSEKTSRKVPFHMWGLRFRQC